MRDHELINALRRLKVETRSLACLGCEHEHNCGVHGCAIMREAADRIANMDTHILALQKETEKLRGQVHSPNISHFRPVLDIGFCTGFDA